MTANPIPPLLILPPVSLSLTIASALIGFLAISCMGRRGKTATPEEIADKERRREKKRIRQDEASAETENATLKRETDARLAQLDRVWDAQTAREQSRAWDAVEARAAARRVTSSPFEVVQVVEVS